MYVRLKFTEYLKDKLERLIPSKINLEEGSSVSQLIDKLRSILGKSDFEQLFTGVAIVVNGKLVSKSEIRTRTLSDGDEVIFHSSSWRRMTAKIS